MKAGIIISLGEMVKDKFGKPKWEAVLQKAGLPKNTIFIPIQDMDDKVVLNIVKTTCAVLHLTFEEVSETFGDYWVNNYTPNIYKSYFKGSHSARELLKQMDRVHEAVMANIPNARPPRFSYEWPNDKTLVMKYISERGMIDMLVGCAKGAGRYFGEDITVRKLGDDRIEVVFNE